MKKKILEYIKIACLVILAISFTFIAWQLSEIINLLQLIYEKITSIYNVINAYQPPQL